MTKVLLIGIALVSGVGLAMQVGFNNELRDRIGHPLPAAIVSFVIGTIALLALALVTRPPFDTTQAVLRGPWWIWMGGLVGAVYVASAAAYAARLGAASWLGLIITGQIVTSLVLDHFGLIGFTRHPVNSMRLVGAALLLAGVVLVLRN